MAAPYSIAADSAALASSPSHGTCPVRKYPSALITRNRPKGSTSRATCSKSANTTATEQAIRSGRHRSLKAVDSRNARLKNAALAMNRLAPWTSALPMP